MGHTRKRNHLTQKKKWCHIHISHPAQLSSSKVGNDFYGWVNDSWISNVFMPPFENDFGASEEVERCVYKKSADILEKSSDKLLKTLQKSFEDNPSDTSLEYLKSILTQVSQIETKEDVIKFLSLLARSRVDSIFKYSYYISPNKICYPKLLAETPSLDKSYYTGHDRTFRYKKLLNDVGLLFNIQNLAHVYEFEKTLALEYDYLTDDNDYSIKGGKLLSKFPQIPWKIWFENADLPEWKYMTVYYNSPRWIRFIGRTIHTVDLNFWKLYISKIYIFHALPYLSSPYSDLHFNFFGAFIQGQKEKLPRLELCVNTIFKYLSDLFSEIFWKEAGDPLLVDEMQKFSKNMLKAAKKRILNSEWLEKYTKEAAIDKIKGMSIKIVKPDTWEAHPDLKLDADNLLKNIYDLGRFNIAVIYARSGRKYTFWDEGIFRVNAYYFNENNELIIPYGTIMSPFYSREASDAWNYGALGCIIGHEMCHAFDEDGKNYLTTGVKKDWWTHSDNMKYIYKTKKIIKMFENQDIHGKHVNGYKTISENIADSGGLSIALQALKSSQKDRGLLEEECLEEYRDFFISFATSWRTKYRKEKLDSSIDLDVHAPAFLRVNLVVSQMKEWYDAFDIKEDARLYRKPEDRVIIF